MLNVNGEIFGEFGYGWIWMDMDGRGQIQATQQFEIWSLHVGLAGMPKTHTEHLQLQDVQGIASRRKTVAVETSLGSEMGFWRTFQDPNELYIMEIELEEPSWMKCHFKRNSVLQNRTYILAQWLVSTRKSHVQLSRSNMKLHLNFDMKLHLNFEFFANTYLKHSKTSKTLDFITASTWNSHPQLHGRSMSFPWGGPRWAQTRLGRLLGHHYAFVVTRWGFGKSMATILARAGGVNTEIPGGLCHFFCEGWMEGEPKKNLRYWPWYIYWLVVWNLEPWNFMTFHILEMSSSQLTNIFQRGWNHQPVYIYINMNYVDLHAAYFRWYVIGLHLWLQGHRILLQWSQIYPKCRGTGRCFWISN